MPLYKVEEREIDFTNQRKNRQTNRRCKQNPLIEIISK